METKNAQAQDSRLPTGLESHPGLAQESLYAEAVLAFNRKQTAEAIKILDELLKGDPRHLEALELKALALKSSGNDAQSLEVYQRLIQLKPPAERGLYHFEMGVILHRQKKSEAARPHFEKAAALQANEVASYLFLGLIAFQAGDMRSAEASFSQVASKGSTEFRAVGRYYLGLIHFKNGYGAGGTSELVAARTLAMEVPESKMASDIKTGIDKILAPFNKSQWFGNLSLLGQYDTNISQIPTVGSVSSSASSGKATPKISLSGGIGRMSSPMSTIQWVVSYRASINKNTNVNTRSYEFVSNTLSNYFNYRPLSTTNGGLKVEGVYAFQNQPVETGNTEGAYHYAPYNLGGDFGPYFKHQFNSRASMQIDASYRPQKYYSESGMSGKSLYGRFSTKMDTDSSLLSPGASVSYEANLATSAEFRYRSVGAGLSDVARISAKDTLTLYADFLSVNYGEASVPRLDRNLTIRTSYMRSLGRSWSILADLSYIKNISNIESYTYDRVTAGLGISWVP